METNQILVLENFPKLRKAAVLSLLSALLVLQSGCMKLYLMALPRPPKSWHKEFYRLPLSERQATLEGYSPDQQIDLYLWAIRWRHHGDLALEKFLASHPLWRQYLPPIQQRLLNSLEDDELFELILLLYSMTRYHQRDLRGEAELFAAIDRAVDWISAPYEEDVEWYVNEIRAGPRKP